MQGSERLVGIEKCQVTGVIGALGAYTSPSYDGTEDHAKGTVTLVAWRINGGNIETGQLVVSTKIGHSENARRKFEERFASDAIVSATADKMPLNLVSLQLLRAAEINEAPHDEELLRTAHSLNRPPVFLHPTLGEFKPHPRLPWEYTGSAQWGEVEVEVWLQESPPKADHDQLRRRADNLAQILAHQSFFLESLQAVLIEQLYPKWLAQSVSRYRPELSREDWLRKLPVKAIYPTTGNLVEFQLDGEELFGNDEAVMASALLSEGFTSAELVS